MLAAEKFRGDVACRVEDANDLDSVPRGAIENHVAADGIESAENSNAGSDCVSGSIR